MPKSTETNWTTRKLLAWTAEHLARKGVDSPKLAAEMLLAHVLDMPRLNLFMDADRPAAPLERAAYRELVERAVACEPVQYLVGLAHFFSLEFKVDKRVLIPRPSTETLVQHVIEHCRRTPGFADPLIADIGTGSGCIAISLAKNLPGARIMASDICEDALALAKENAAKHKVADRIDFLHGPLYEPFRGHRFNFIVSNPPYIPEDEWAAVEPNVKDHEPTTALRAGVDGLDVLRPLINDAHKHLADPAQLVLEIAASQKDAALTLARDAKGLTSPTVLADLERHPRMLIADHK